MPSTSTMAALGLFQDEEHQPFLWEAGRPAALLLHGFMGTPAEMRPLAETFRRAGWTTQGLLLPGFGRELDTLFERHFEEWVEAAGTALDDLKGRHSPVIMLGYSMGAAVALNAAARRSTDGLILAAPFWRIGTPIQRLIWQIVKRLFRRPQPFKRANFEDRRLREFVGGLLPELDLSDPATQEILRELRVPTSFADEIIAVGKEAGQAATKVTAPILIVQGTDDEAVRVDATRQLLQRFPGAIQYRELASDHELVSPDNPGFADLSSAALRFASDLAAVQGVTQGTPNSDDPAQKTENQQLNQVGQLS